MERRIVAVAIVVWVLVAVGLVYAKAAKSAEYGLELHGKSEHRDVGPFNERNPGIGFYMSNDERTLSLQVGTMRNSHRIQSVYASVEWLPIKSRWLDLGVGVGGVTGYIGMAVHPAAYALAHVNITPNTHLVARYIPPLPDGMRGLTSFSIGRTFNERW